MRKAHPDDGQNAGDSMENETMKSYQVFRGKKLVATVAAESIEVARDEAVRLDPRNHGATLRRHKRPVGGGSQFEPDAMLDVDPRDRLSDPECDDCGCDPCECGERA